MRLPSNSIHRGRHAENTAYRDDRYVKCGRCKHTINLDRHVRHPYGSRAGQGVTYSSAPTYDQITLNYDAESGYNGYEPDFNVSGGCPFCGAFTYDKGAYNG